MKTILRCGLAIALAGGMVIFILSIASAAQGIESPQADTIKVPDDYSTIQAAINAANQGDIILVAAGVYTENLSIRKEISLSGGWSSNFSTQIYGDSIINANDAGRAISITCVTSDTLVTIEGFSITNGNASGLGIPSQSSPATHVRYPAGESYDLDIQKLPDRSPVELSSAIQQGIVAPGELFDFPGGESAYQAFLDQLSWRTAQAQNAFDQAQQPVSPHPPAASGSGAGGGVYSYNASLTLSNNIIEDNLASVQAGSIVTDPTCGLGGGIYINQAPDSAVQVTNNQIFMNQACRIGQGNGGGLYLTNANGALISNNLFEGNIASSYGDSYGGGAYLVDADGAQIEDNTFQQNIGLDADGVIAYTAGGGALAVVESSGILVSANQVYSNTANAAWNSYGGVAGGFFLSAVNGALVEENIFENNLASLQTGGMGGGLHLQLSEDVNLLDNTFYRNWASLYTPPSSLGGGGFSMVDVYSVTVQDNDAYQNIAVVYGGANAYGGGFLGNELQGAVKIIENQFSHNLACAQGQFGAGGGLQVSDSTGVTIADNQLTDNQAAYGDFPGLGGGLLLRGLKDGNLLRNRIAENTGGGQLSAAGGLAIDSFSSDSENLIVDSNLFLDNGVTYLPDQQIPGGQISILMVGGYFSFSNNVIADYLTPQFNAIDLDLVPNASLINNTILNDGAYAIIAAGNDSIQTQLSLQNNIIVSATTGVSLTDVTASAIDYTLWQGVDTEVVHSGSGSFTNTHPVYGEPSFVDPGQGNFRIPVNSAARDTGHPAGVPPAPDHDADQNPRPHGLAVDLGAYEYQGFPVHLPVLLKQDSIVGWVVGNAVDDFGAILRTRDGGQTWVRQGSSADIPNVDLASVAAIDALNAWVVGGSASGTNPGGYGVILRTRDGGQSWQRQGSPAQVPDAGLLGVYALDGNTAWAAGLNGVILHTADGGQTWTQQGQGQVPAVQLQGVYASDPNHCWIVGSAHDGNLGTVLRTTDGGLNWTEVNYTLTRKPDQTSLIMVHGVDADTVWIAGLGQASYTSDGGATWTDQWFPGIGPYHVNGVFARNPLTVWLAVDYGGIYRSDDGGYNYTKQDAGTFAEVMRLFAIDDQRVWAVTVDPFPPFTGDVLGSTDGGQTWLEQTTPIQTSWSWVSFVK